MVIHFPNEVPDYLVDAQPLGAAISMIRMLAWKIDLWVPSFISHLTNDTSVFPEKK